MTLRSFSILLTAMFGFGSLGCSSSITTGTVTGKVAVGDKPLKGGTISFVLKENPGEVPPATGMINEDGTFSVENVPHGDLLVSVVPAPTATTMGVDPGKAKQMMAEYTSTGRPVPPEILAMTAPPSAAAPKSPVGPQYQDPNTSGLTFTHSTSSTVYDCVIK